MKTKVFYLIIILFFGLLSCNNQEELIKNDQDCTKMTLYKKGIFEPTQGINVSGSGEIKTNCKTKSVYLENFNISAGPDLKVYLSKSNSPNEIVNLGALENNKFVYSIPENVRLEDYGFILIHCQQYNHLYAVATLN